MQPSPARCVVHTPLSHAPLLHIQQGLQHSPEERVCRHRGQHKLEAGLTGRAASGAIPAEGRISGTAGAVRAQQELLVGAPYMRPPHSSQARQQALQRARPVRTQLANDHKRSPSAGVGPLVVVAAAAHRHQRYHAATDQSAGADQQPGTRRRHCTREPAEHVRWPAIAGILGAVVGHCCREGLWAKGRKAMGACVGSNGDPAEVRASAAASPPGKRHRGTHSSTATARRCRLPALRCAP